MKKILISLSCLFALVGITLAQGPTDPNEGSRLSSNSVTGVYTFGWWGRYGRTYFIQHSDDLIHWSYFPVIETGLDQPIQWGFTSTGNRFFVRLRYTDIPTYNPFTADFDSDGVGNYNELMQGTDPLSAQMDANGLPFDWETYFNIPFGTPSGNLASVGNGLTLLQCYQQKANPVQTASTEPFNVSISATGPFQAPANIVLVANVTHPSTSTIQHIDFYQGSTLVGTATQAPYQCQVTASYAGIFLIQAIAYDSTGATATATTQIQVLESNFYSRGWGANQTFISTIVAVDFEKGTFLDASQIPPVKPVACKVSR